MDQGKSYIDKDGLAWCWADDGVNEPDWTQQVVHIHPHHLVTGPMGLEPEEIEREFGPLREATEDDDLSVQMIRVLDEEQ